MITPIALTPFIPCYNQGCQEKYSKICGRCKQVFYCSVQCQTNDWKTRHKNVCVRRESQQQPISSSVQVFKSMNLGAGASSLLPETPESVEDQRIQAITDRAIPDYPEFMDRSKGMKLNKGEFLQFCDWQTKRNSMRLVLRNEIKAIPHDPLNTAWIEGLALSRFGLGTCGELAAAAAEKLVEKHSIVRIRSFDSQNENKNHAFLLIDVEKVIDLILELFKRDNFSLEQLFKSLPPDIKIVDPYYKYFGNLKDLERKCPDFFKLTSEFQARIFGVLKKNDRSFKECTPKADLLYSQCKDRLPKAIDCSSKYFELFTEVERSLLSQINTCFEKIECLWEFDRTTLQLISRAASDSVNQITSVLEAYKIPHELTQLSASEGSFLVIIKTENLQIVDQNLNF